MPMYFQECNPSFQVTSQKSSGLSALALRGPDSSQGLIRPQIFAVDSKKSVLVPVLSSYQPGNPNTSQLCKLQKPSLSATTPTTLQGARSGHLHGTAPARPEILGIVHEKSTILSVLRPRCGFSQPPTGAPKKKRWVLLDEVPFHCQVGPHLCDVAYVCLFQDQPQYLENGPKCQVSSARIKRLPN